LAKLNFIERINFISFTSFCHQTVVFSGRIFKNSSENNILTLFLQLREILTLLIVKTNSGLFVALLFPCCITVVKVIDKKL